MSNVRCTATVIATLAVVLVVPTQAAHAATPAKDVIKCHKALASSVNKFFSKKQKTMGKCTDALFACRIKQENDGEDPAKCLERAQKKCQRTLAKLADPDKGLAAKMRKTWGKRCAKVALDDLVDAPGGMGYDTPLALCALQEDVTEVADLLDCMTLVVAAVVDMLTGVLTPRTCEFLLAQGLEGTPALTALPQLWTTTVTQQLTASGKDVWSVIVPGEAFFFIWVDNMDDGGGMANVDLVARMESTVDAEDFEGDEHDCRHAVIPACAASDECPVLGEIVDEGDAYLLDVEDQCGQGAGGYKITMVSVGLGCGQPQPTLTLVTDDDP